MFRQHLGHAETSRESGDTVKSELDEQHQSSQAGDPILSKCQTDSFFNIFWNTEQTQTVVILWQSPYRKALFSLPLLRED